MAFNWEKVNIDISKVRGGKGFCPNCHHTRKNKNDRELSVNLQTGQYNCHNGCGFQGSVAGVENFIGFRERKVYEKPLPRLQKVSDKTLKFFEDRGISNNTLLRMKVTESREWMPQFNEEVAVICFNYFKNEVLTNIKYRGPKKSFKLVKDAELILYNLDAIKDTKELIIVEGEMDCLTCMESKVYNVVSVPNGASKSSNNKLEYIDNSWQELEKIEKFIIAVDDDAAGNNLRDALVFRFGVDKCWILEYPKELVVNDGEKLRACKDLNEVLMHFGEEVVRKCVLGASQPKIEGVYTIMDTSDELVHAYEHGAKMGETTHSPEMDRAFKWKKGDINVWFGYGNFGKTIACLYFMLAKSMYNDWRWAVFCPENFPAVDFFIDLIEMYTQKHIDDRMGNKMSREEFNDAMEFFNDHFFYVYPEEMHDITSMNKKFRQMILRWGIDGVLFDPWNQGDHEFDGREDTYLSIKLKEIKRFALHNNISYNIIVHPRSINADKDGKRPKIEVWHISGGAMWNNKTDNIISVDRPEWHENKSSPWTRLETHKIKRRRTGGANGVEVDLMYLPSKSTFCERDSNKIICDKARALEYKERELVKKNPIQKNTPTTRDWSEREIEDLNQFEGF